MQGHNTRERTSGGWRGVRLAGWLALFVVGTALWIYYVNTAEAPRAWRAFLVNFIYFAPMAAGLVTWGAVVLACHGRWMGPLERYTVTGMGFAIPSIVALGVLWAGSPTWAPWYGKPVIQGAWLNNTLVFTRDMAALVVFWLVAWAYVRRRAQGRGGKLRGVLILAFGMAFGLIGYDLVMSLDNRWYSTLFGMYFFVLGAYSAVAAWTFMSVWHPGVDRGRLADLGTITLAFSLIAVYMTYSQLLPIWYANLPNEVRFVIPRRNFWPWASISITLLAAVYLGPLVMLLTRAVKRSPVALGTVMVVILAGLWVNGWWLVAPTFQRRPTYGVVEAAATAAFLGAMGLAVEMCYWRMRFTVPEEAEGQ